MPSWCLVYRLSTCKFELRFVPGRCLALFVSFIGIFKSGDPEKMRGWQCLLFPLVDFSSFLELLPTSCGPFIFFPHLYWWLSILLKMAFPWQNPHQRTIPIFQSVPFPPTILPQQVDAGAIKNEGCVS